MKAVEIAVTDNEKLKSFLELEQVVGAQFRAQELAVYSTSLKKNSQSLSEMAIKGFEEHNLFDDLAYKIKYENNFDQWLAQVKIFCQILEMHLSEEENDYFPEIKKFFSAVELDRAAVQYLKIKKSEQAKLQLTKKRNRDDEIHLLAH